VREGEPEEIIVLDEMVWDARIVPDADAILEEERKFAAEVDAELERLKLAAVKESNNEDQNSNTP
jgi:hypothetical protein